MTDLKVLLTPSHLSCSPETGIGRIVLTQNKYLPELGIQFVDNPSRADLIVCHVNRTGNLPRVDVMHVHGMYWSDTPHWPYANWHVTVNRMVIQGLRETQVMTVPSEWVAQSFRRDMRLRPNVIGHGIDLDEWRPERNLHYVLWNKNRNTDVCNPVWAYELGMRNVDVLSTFAPIGKETVIPPSMKVTGLLPFPQMRTAIACADVYLATTMETFGIGTLEALACGVPVLGFDWGGTRDIVRHGVEGYLVEPGNMDGLLEGLAWIRGHRRELSANARARAEEFAWDKIMLKYADLYRSVTNGSFIKGVAVIIPCYNYGHYLKECIDSLLYQTRRPDEIIIVDDCSTDDSLQVAREICAKNPFIKLIEHSQNQGVAAARNHGIEACKSPLVVCLDADDMLSTDYIATVAGEMERDPSLGIGYTGLAMVHETGRITESEWPPEFDWSIMTTVSIPPANCIPSAAMFRREMWRRSGGYKQIYAPAEDTEFWVRGLSIGFNCRKVSTAPLFLYRPHQGSASRRLEYRTIDAYHPWMRDHDYPMGAPDQRKPVIRSYALPDISVIIPLGPGHLRYLPAALDSLLGQTFRNWEVIVINDTDQAVEEDMLLSPYPFPRYLHTGRAGSGAGTARNIGLAAARAPMIFFLDADDYIAPHTLENMLKAFAESGGRYIYTDWMSIDADNQVKAHELNEYDAREWIEGAVSGKGGLNSISVLISSIDARFIGFNQKLPALEDTDFFARCAVAGIWGKRLAEPMLYYRIYSGQRRIVGQKERAKITQYFEDQYKDYLKGDKKMAQSCCGGSASAAILAAKRAIGEIPSSNETQVPGPPTTIIESAVVRMEFIGVQKGPVTYWGNNGRNYRGADSASYKFINAHPADVEKLENTGFWRRVNNINYVENQTAASSQPIQMTGEQRRNAAEEALLRAKMDFANNMPSPDFPAHFDTPQPAQQPASPPVQRQAIQPAPDIPVDRRRAAEDALLRAKMDFAANEPAPDAPVVSENISTPEGRAAEPTPDKRPRKRIKLEGNNAG